MSTRPRDPVRGFSYEPLPEFEEPRRGLIVQIIDRAPEEEASDDELISYGPAFKVRFGDGEERVAYASELRPWYPT